MTASSSVGCFGCFSKPASKYEAPADPNAPPKSDYLKSLANASKEYKEGTSVRGGKDKEASVRAGLEAIARKSAAIRNGSTTSKGGGGSNKGAKEAAPAAAADAQGKAAAAGVSGALETKGSSDGAVTVAPPAPDAKDAAAPAVEPAAAATVTPEQPAATA